MHNLTNIIPPPGVKIPLIPLTDTELIVFFFNALQRPMVSLRLYARNWGPAKITHVLNEYRDIKPDGYHRNTCSVKCTTAIKRGREKFGDEWESYWSNFFLAADNADATDAVRLQDYELKSQVRAADYRVLDLFKGLKKFPNQEDTGIFSTAVEWCSLNQVDIGLSLIHKVVIALEHGLDPSDALAEESLPVEDMLSETEVVEHKRDAGLIVSVASTISSSHNNVDEDLLALEDSEDDLVMSAIDTD
jgi:hypothetical protein